MRKKTSRIIAGLMILAAAAFFAYALGHPEASFPWSNKVSYAIYGAYVLIMALLFAAPFKD